MEIKPTYTTFEQSKWLKEKGFEAVQNFYYDFNGSVCSNYTPLNWNQSKDDLYSRPEQWMVIEWTTQFDIYVTYTVCELGSDEWEYGYKIKYIPKEFENAKRRCVHFKEMHSFEDNFSTYTGAWRTIQEAYSAAFDYIIKKYLI